MHQLYTFRRCPYAMRARLALTLIDEPFHAIEVDLKNKPASLLEISPKGTVPVLILHPSHDVLDESLDIVHWALNKRLPSGWSPLHEHEQDLAQSWLKTLHQEFIPALNRIKYTRPNEDYDPNHDRQILSNFFHTLETEQLTKEALLSSQSWADICLLPFVRQLSIATPQWFASLPYTKLREWLDNWLRSAAFKHIMKKSV